MIIRREILISIPVPIIVLLKVLNNSYPKSLPSESERIMYCFFVYVKVCWSHGRAPLLEWFQYSERDVMHVNSIRSINKT